MPLQHDEQAGLESVPYESGLEVYHPPKQNHLTPFTDSKEYISSRPQQTPASKPWWKKKRWFTTAIGLFILVIAGAVVGGVLGSQKKSHHSTSTDGDSDSPQDNSIKLSKSTFLAATGWRFQGNSGVQVFYQGEDSFVYTSSRNTSAKGWQKAVQVAIGAVPNTPMSASIIYQAADVSPFVSLLPVLSRNTRPLGYWQKLTRLKTIGRVSTDRILLLQHVRLPVRRELSVDVPRWASRLDCQLY